MLKNITKLVYLGILVLFMLFFTKSFHAIDIFTDENNLGCGYANTEANQCCIDNTTYDIEEKDLNTAIEKIKNCTISRSDLPNKRSDPGFDLKSCGINDQEASIITRLILTEKNELIRAIHISFLRKYLVDQSETKKENFYSGELNMGIGQFEVYLRSKREEYNNLSESEKIALQTSIGGEEKCLINGIVTGLCVKDSSNYALVELGKNPKFNSALENTNNLVIDTCVIGAPKTGEDGSCTCINETELSLLCSKYIKDSIEYNRCAECMESKGGFWTGFGCIGLSFQGFVQETLFGWALGLAGIITLICIFIAAFMLQTSAGNPERLKKARQYLTACITGLLLIIFSILILRIIGINILRIPGFN